MRPEDAESVPVIAANNRFDFFSSHVSLSLLQYGRFFSGGAEGGTASASGGLCGAADDAGTGARSLRRGDRGHVPLYRLRRLSSGLQGRGGAVAHTGRLCLGRTAPGRKPGAAKRSLRGGDLLGRGGAVEEAGSGADFSLHSGGGGGLEC